MRKASFNNQPLLALQAITSTYGGVPTVQDIDLSINEGQRVGLVGPNGAGKSTIAGIITGIEKATAGILMYEMVERRDWRAPGAVRQGVVLVPEGRHIFPNMSVEDNLLLGAFVHSIKKRRKGRRKEVYEILPVLREKRKQKAGQLSGGQQQMVAIGRALMTDPRLLVLDEPFLGVAPIIVKAILTTLDRVCATGVAVILIEQSIERVLAFADFAYVIEGGAVVMKGSPEQLRRDANFVKKYMGIA